MEKIEIKNILNKKYNRDNWKILTKDIFSDVEYFKEPKKIATENNKILEFVQIGNLKLKDKKIVALFELKLIKDLNIYKNKIELRNIVTKFIDQYSSHGVLVVFDNQSSDYRLTFSSKYSEITESGEIIEIETAPKRYTYLLGENESCTTAAERLFFLKNLKNNIKIENILEAFNVQKITDEFFETYKNLYLKLYDEIEKLVHKDKKVKATFQKNKVTIEEFSKKLLSQIVFIYFLQKKGWLGLKKNDDKIFEKWGKGDKNFMQNLFKKKYCNYKNFFNDVLEPLFVAFSTDLPENYYSKLNTKIPFLNGGLFDPIKNYDWLETDIVINNTVIGEILDSFEMYNFTIQEEDPEEKEVAIDPEMLGKVFENLLTIKDRKSKGTFYTPRKIAKYICEEALKNNLIIHFGNDTKTSFDKFFKNPLDKDLNKFLQKNYQEIDDKLKKIKICDPAIGSGEFPVELMNLCVFLRSKINLFFNDNKRTNYLMKRNFIQNSIYGVDIEDSAVETSKLRLWLSLIIDETDYSKILPLPNLDYKIFKGDSLLGLESNLLGFEIKDDVNKLKKEYFKTTNIKKKLELKKEIDNKFNSILDGQISFDYKIFFNEVFQENNGFDLIIGNPPYVQIQKIDNKLYKSQLDKNYKVFKGTADLYCLFFEKGIQLLNQKGCLAYITSNKWLKTSYGNLLRNYFLNNTKIIRLIDFKALKIFKRASVDTSILILKKGNFDVLLGTQVKSIDEYLNLHKTIENKTVRLKISDLNGPWSIESKKNIDLLNKIKNLQNRLQLNKKKFRYGIKTGLNKAFIVDKNIRNQIIDQRSKSRKIFEKVIRGTCLNKFSYTWDNCYLINSHNGFDENEPVNVKKDFPDIFNYLSKYEDSLKKRSDKVNHWSNLRSCSYIKEFKLPKVAWMNMNRGWKFSYIPENYYIEASLNFLADKDYAKFLVGIYSSNLHKWFFKKIGRMFDDGGYMCKIDTISSFPVIKPTIKQKLIIEKYVDDLSKVHIQKDKEKYENYVMDLYSLNEIEKKLIRETS
jgi:hypothetical protein